MNPGPYGKVLASLTRLFLVPETRRGGRSLKVIMDVQDSASQEMLLSEAI